MLTSRLKYDLWKYGSEAEVTRISKKYVSVNS
jgi:hypothetical protein